MPAFLNSLAESKTLAGMHFADDPVVEEEAPDHAEAEAEEQPAVTTEPEGAEQVPATNEDEAGETPETPETPEAAEETEETEETEPDGTETEDEAEPEGAEVEDLYDIPADGKFEIPIEDGKTKTYTGEALIKMVNQGRLADRKNAELKAEREKWESDRDSWRETEAKRLATERDDAWRRDLIAMGVYVRGADGKWSVNPSVRPGQSSPAEATKPTAPKIKRMSLENISEANREFTDPALIETYNSLAEFAETQSTELAQIKQALADERARKEQEAQETQKQRADRIYKETTDALTGDPILSKIPDRLKAAEADSYFKAIESGFEGSTADYFAKVAQEYAPVYGSTEPPATPPASGGQGTATKQPEAASGTVRKTAPPKRKAPPAPGSAARTTQAPTGRKKASGPSPEFGSFENRDRISKVLDRITKGR